jgi:hypothetical protein
MNFRISYRLSIKTPNPPNRSLFAFNFCKLRKLILLSEMQLETTTKIWFTVFPFLLRVLMLNDAEWMCRFWVLIWTKEANVSWISRSGPTGCVTVQATFTLFAVQNWWPMLIKSRSNYIRQLSSYANMNLRTAYNALPFIPNFHSTLNVKLLLYILLHITTWNQVQSPFYWRSYFWKWSRRQNFGLNNKRK